MSKISKAPPPVPVLRGSASIPTSRSSFVPVDCVPIRLALQMVQDTLYPTQLDSEPAVDWLRQRFFAGELRAAYLHQGALVDVRAAQWGMDDYADVAFRLGVDSRRHNQLLVCRADLAARLKQEQPALVAAQEHWSDAALPLERRVELWVIDTIAAGWDTSIRDWYSKCDTDLNPEGTEPFSERMFRRSWNQHATDHMRRPGPRPRPGHCPALERR
jgi:hypothetical protein